MGGGKGGVGAIAGGTLGFAVGGPMGAAIGAGLGSSLGGSMDAAKGAQHAAEQQALMSKRAFQASTRIADQATVSGLANMDKALAVQERSLAGQEKLLAQIDPAIMEASQQALRLMRGESSKTLAPAQEQRRMQREKLLSSLREQLGPGAETSTAGIQALTRFDSETNQLMAGQQQQALQNLGQTFGVFSSYRPQLGAEAGNMANIANMRAGLQFNQAGVYQQAYRPMIDSAGASYVGQIARGQQMQALGNTLLGAAAQGAGSAWGAKMAGS